MLKLHTTGHIVCVGSLWTVKHTESKIGPSNYMGKSQPSLPGSQQCDARIPASQAERFPRKLCLLGQGDLQMYIEYQAEQSPWPEPAWLITGGPSSK